MVLLSLSLLKGKVNNKDQGGPCPEDDQDGVPETDNDPDCDTPDPSQYPSQCQTLRVSNKNLHFLNTI